MEIEISVFRNHIVVKGVPETTWEQLKPYWKDIAKAVLEVFKEGKFKPYDVRKTRPDGVYAAPWYWTKFYNSS